MECPNLSHPDNKLVIDRLGENAFWSIWNQNNGIIPEFILTQLRNDSKSSNVKPGVEELFNENPELANSVYEALGFKTDKSGLFELTHYSRNNQNPLDNFREDYPLYTSRGESSEYKDYGKQFNYIVKKEAVVKNILDFHGKYGIDLDMHDMRSNGIQPYHFSLQEIQSIRSEGVDIIIDDWGEYIILNPNSVVIKEQQKQQAIQVYSNFLINFININFDTIIQDLESKNILNKKCS